MFPIQLLIGGTNVTRYSRARRQGANAACYLPKNLQQESIQEYHGRKQFGRWARTHAPPAAYREGTWPRSHRSACRQPVAARTRALRYDADGSGPRPRYELPGHPEIRARRDPHLGKPAVSAGAASSQVARLFLRGAGTERPPGDW